MLEDDVEFDATFKQFIDESTSYPDWADIVKLQGSNKRRWVVGAQFGSIQKRRLVFVPGNNTNGSAAYVVTRTGARKIVEQMPMIAGCGTDHALFTYELSGIKTLHVLPYPAKQRGKSIIRDVGFQSQIKGIRRDAAAKSADDLKEQKSQAIGIRRFVSLISVPWKIVKKRATKSGYVLESFLKARKLIGSRIYALRVCRVQSVANYRKV